MSYRFPWYYVWQFSVVIIIAIFIHNNFTSFLHKITEFNYRPTNFEVINIDNQDWKNLYYELELLRKEVKEMRRECQDFDSKLGNALDRFYSDQLGALGKHPVR